MARSYLKNAVDVELAANVNPGDPTITVNDPTPLPDLPFYLVINPLDDDNREYCRCTNVVGSVLTVDRNLDGTEDQTHLASQIVRISYVAQILDDLWDDLDGIFSMPAGGVLGDSLRKMSATDGVTEFRDNVFVDVSEPASPIEGDLWLNPDDNVVSGDFLPISGGTLTGPLILDADPSLPLEAATKQYVDSTELSIDHDDLTGVTPDQHHTRYTDPEAVAATDGVYLDKTGDSVTGDQALESKLVRNITASAVEPTAPNLGDIWLDLS